jgi:phage host-nuclease inhibitor protein Gam
MASKVTRLKQPAQPTAYVPQNRDECAELINQIGRISREIEGIKSKMNDAIAKITDDYTGKATAQEAVLKQLREGVQAWCEANRSDLTQNGKSKSAEFVTGTVQWRQRPPSVVIRGAESVLETLARLKLDRFIRSKQEINKEAILNEPAAVQGVAGITIKTGVEDFVITPFENKL